MCPIYVYLVAAIVCADPQPRELDPSKIKELMTVAAKVECIRHSREPAFTMIFQTPEEIANLAKHFDPMLSSREYPSNSRVLHKWVIRIIGRDRRAAVVHVFGENKLVFDADDQRWLADLESKGFHRFLTARAAELGSPDPLVPSSILEGLQSDVTLPKLESLRLHKVLMHPTESVLFVTEEATDALVIYHRSQEGGIFSRLQVFQSTQPEHEIPNSTQLDHMRGPYFLAQSDDGAHAYLSCGLSNSICVFQRDEADAFKRWKRIQVCIDQRDGVDGLRRAGPLAVSADGKHVYVAAFSGALACFLRNDDGTLTFRSSLTGQQDAFKKNGQPLDFLKLPTSIVVSPDGQSVYVTDFPTQGILHFRRDTRSGQLTAERNIYDQTVNGHFVPADRGLLMPKSMAISEDGKNLYVCTVRGTLSTWDRNETTGALEFVELHADGRQGVKGINYAVEVSAVRGTNRICVVGQNSHGFAQFERGADGRLKFVSSHTCAAHDRHSYMLPASLAVSSDLRFFYIASGKKTLMVLGIHHDPYNDRMAEPK